MLGNCGHRTAGMLAVGPTSCYGTANSEVSSMLGQGGRCHRGQRGAGTVARPGE